MYHLVFSAKPKKFDDWQKIYSWIRYDNDKHRIFCSTCSDACQKDLLLPNDSCAKSSKKAFVEDGFRTFTNALTSFKSHEKSEFHKSAMQQLINYNGPSISQTFSKAMAKELIENRKALSSIFTSILFLSRQGLAFRGHEDKNSNLYQLLKTRCEEIPELKNWLNRDGRKWLHHTIIDEIINLFASHIRDKILAEIKGRYFAITLDETSDISNLEQVSVCLRVVKDDLSIWEYFMSFEETGSTKAESLLNLVKKFLKERDLQIQLLRGQCYDGARNVQGRLTGLQARVREIEPRALYVHCSAHNLNLCVQDSLEDIPIVRNVIGTVKESINFIRDSPKRMVEFKEEQTDDSPSLVKLCPTR